jgi:large subunit ribosomal protein L5
MNISLKDLYLKEVWQKAPWHAPRITRVVVNMGVGRSKDDKVFLAEAEAELGMIAGQKPKLSRARKSISNFKLREGELIGLSATLRGERMWAFLDKLVRAALPRVRDFRGISPKAFDGHGNYTLGIPEHAIFTEVDPNKATHLKGLEITIVTSCKKNEEAFELLKTLGMPFAKAKKSKSKDQ